MRLANTKTKHEVGLDFVLRSINIQTPFGHRLLKSLKPFAPGQEEDLRREFDKTNRFLEIVHRDRKSLNPLLHQLMEVKEATFTIERSSENVLSMVELFEIKNLLLKMDKIRVLMSELMPEVPAIFQLENIIGLLDVLDPRKERINTFYIYDEFSGQLGPFRAEKRALELEVRREMKQRKQELEARYGLAFTPKFECPVQKSNEKLMQTVKEIPELFMSDQDYMTVTYAMKPSQRVYELNQQMEELNTRLDGIEFHVRKGLSSEIGKWKDALLANCERIAEIDLALAKAVYAKDHDCVEPEIVREHILEFRDGRQLEVEDVLQKKGKEYCPVSISLKEGVSCITGANMGGKTVCLKLAGMVAILTHYGFFVPCRDARVGLSSSIHILIGDSQSLQRGLSSFGSEMEELKDVLDHSKERAFILIDEIASGTNPSEGAALTRAVIEYLNKHPYICLITTHFDGVNPEDRGQNLQVVGLANADFKKLDKELRYANRKDRIDIVGRYMDYNLRVIQGEQTVSREAINIAKMLGIYDEIIDNAKKYM
jgi:dsDNA-specific endonuclease/ATPase MutS2